MITELDHSHTRRCWWNPEEARWVCTTAPRPDRPLVDVRDMVVVHTALLREFRLAPAAVRRTAPGDVRRARAVARHLDLVAGMLHHHHEAEDALLWPKLVARTPASARAALDEGEAQHAGLDTALTRVAELLGDWRRDPRVGEELAAELERLHGALAAHLDLEEQALLPLAAAVLTPAEWHEIGAAGAASMAKSDLALALGMFAYEGDPAVLALMLQAVPAVPRKILPLVAPRLYARRARTVHGTAHP